MFALAFRSLKRGSELTACLTDNIWELPGGILVFNFTEGKLLRAQAEHTMGVAPDTLNLSTCAVACVKSYVATANWMGIDLAHGPLFRPFTGSEAAPAAAPVPFETRALNAELALWLQRVGLPLGPTFHGIRAAGAIEMALSGEALSSIMDTGGWHRTAQAAHYMKLPEVLCGGGARPLAPATVENYAALNEMRGRHVAFPPLRR